MISAPSTDKGPPKELINPLRRFCIINESGRVVEDAVCDPIRSSGSQRSCCIKFIPSRETRGLGGNLRFSCHFRIF
jgi:hypothetical protein